MGVFLASGPVNRVQVKTGHPALAQELPGRDPLIGLQRALSSPDEPGAGLQPTASGQRSSPNGCCCLLHSGKNHKLKDANNRSRGVTVLAPVSMSCWSSLPGVAQEHLASRSRPWPGRLQQLLLGSFSLFFSHL